MNKLYNKIHETLYTKHIESMAAQTDAQAGVNSLMYQRVYV